MWDVGVANKQENESHSEMHFKSCRVQKLLPACVTATIWSPDLAPVFFLFDRSSLAAVQFDIETTKW